jgi:hypothetical protein
MNDYNVSPEIKAQLSAAYKHAGMETEQQIKDAIENGHDAAKTGTSFHVDSKRMNALTSEMQGQVRSVQTAALRMINDMYRKTMAKTQIALNTNLYTLNQAIDMSAKDFLAQGINCVTYKNGAQVNIASYAETALRTANRRATLQAAGDVRADWGEDLVYVSQYGACSHTCAPWQGKVYIDDVYAGGKAKGDYMLLSFAIDGGLFHPNCRHTSSTYFPDINTVPGTMSEETTGENYDLEQQQRYNERNIRKYKRMTAASLDDDNKAKYAAKVAQWQSKQRDLIDSNSDVLRRDYSREKLRV